MGRKQTKTVYSSLYKLHNSLKEWVCIYCGKAAETKDHVPPLRLVNLHGATYFRKKKIPLLLVRTCSKCNNHLGDRYLFTIAQRKNVIREELGIEINIKKSIARKPAKITAHYDARTGVLWL